MTEIVFDFGQDFQPQKNTTFQIFFQIASINFIKPKGVHLVSNKSLWFMMYPRSTEMALRQNESSFEVQLLSSLQ